ncbi:1038_t:CDS:10, partial [Ambispora leptoticha]
KTEKIEKSRSSTTFAEIKAQNITAKSHKLNSHDRKGEDHLDLPNDKKEIIVKDNDKIRKRENESTFSIDLSEGNQRSPKNNINSQVSFEKNQTTSSNITSFDSRHHHVNNYLRPKAESRYFIIKSHNYENVLKSQSDGIWATQPGNADILSEAFQTSERVVLIFSVNESRHFQGYCVMTSDIGAAKHASWLRINEANLGGNFHVRWIKIRDLPFDRTGHIRNPWNEGKPVKISRDGQELPSNIGNKLCELFETLPEETSTAPDANIESKIKKDHREKLRRSESIADRYKPYDALNRAQRAERGIRARGQMLSAEIERPRLVRELPPREYSRIISHTGEYEGHHGQYNLFHPTFQGHLGMPHHRTWQSFGSHIASHSGQINHHRVPNFERNGRR